jgi:hypothetical protein
MAFPRKLDAMQKSTPSTGDCLKNDSIKIKKREARRKGYGIIENLREKNRSEQGK